MPKTFKPQTRDEDLAMIQIFTLLDSISRTYEPKVSLIDDSFGHAFGTEHAHHWELDADDGKELIIDMSDVKTDVKAFGEMLQREYNFFRNIKDQKGKAENLRLTLGLNVKCVDNELNIIMSWNYRK